MGRGRRALSPHLEAEIRNPNSEARKKPEFRNPKARISDGLRSSAFGFRISFGFRASEFGFQVQGLNARRFNWVKSHPNPLPRWGRGSRRPPISNSALANPWPPRIIRRSRVHKLQFVLRSANG